MKVKKTIHYLCVDDQMDSIPQLLDSVRPHSGRLEIHPMKPIEFEKQTAKILQNYAAGALDGLLIDLRLDEPGPGVEPVSYTAQGLAQQLRVTAARENQALTGFPIVLWTVNARLLELYQRDSTSNDLFDLTIQKERFVPNAKDIIDQLIDLAEGYKRIIASMKQGRSFAEIVDEPEQRPLDPRVADVLPTSKTALPHEYALHILRYLIDRPGPLIDQNYVLARLGTAKECPGADKLLAKIPTKARYNGPFGAAWPRWWAALIERWWRDLVGDTEPRTLAGIPAPERIAILGKKLNLRKLEPAKPIEDKDSYSDRFTTICQCLCVPLDPVDGFALADRISRPWLEKRYVSRKVALSPAKYNFRERLDGLERKRLERLISAVKEDGKKSRRSKS